ncbi:MAG: hypothetical protein ACRD96_17010, partial [Bryobacteraceae bacterium]
MSSTPEKPKRWPWPVRALLVLVGALLIYNVVLAPPVIVTAWAVAKKMRGHASGCEWGTIFTFYSDLMRFSAIYEENLKTFTAGDTDERLGITRVSGLERPFWIPRAGVDRDGRHLLAYLAAEHRWMAEKNPDHGVRRGDTVLD